MAVDSSSLTLWWCAANATTAADTSAYSTEYALSSSSVSISGKVLNLTWDSSLIPGSTYSLAIAAGALRDNAVSSNSFAGLQPWVYNFSTTEEITTPSLVNTTPANATTEV